MQDSKDTGVPENAVPSTSTARGGRLAGKTAIVTGGSSGIGRAICLAYAAEGANVVVADISETSRAASEADISTHAKINSSSSSGGGGGGGGDNALFVKCDVTDSQNIENAVHQAVLKYGRLDIFVNNAGLLEVPVTDANIDFWDIQDSAWHKAIALNQTGVFYGIRAASPQMATQAPWQATGDRGWIINMSSVFGLIGTGSGPAYTASKHAVMGLTRSAALNLAKHRIHVNAINPGFVQSELVRDWLEPPDFNGVITRRHPFRGLGVPQDVARVAVFLASDDAGWVHSTGIVVDGGYTTQ